MVEIDDPVIVENDAPTVEENEDPIVTLFDKPSCFTCFRPSWRLIESPTSFE